MRGGETARIQARLGGADFHLLPLSIGGAGPEVVRRFYDEIGVDNLGLYLCAERMCLDAKLVEGETFPMTLRFESAPEVTVDVPVLGIAAQGPMEASE